MHAGPIGGLGDRALDGPNPLRGWKFVSIGSEGYAKAGLRS